jgi:hypothetical protein
MARLREECVANHKGDLLGKVESLLSGEKGEASYAEIAASLNMSERALKVAVHRLRQHYGELVRAEIAQTVATPEDVAEELQSPTGKNHRLQTAYAKHNKRVIYVDGHAATSLPSKLTWGQFYGIFDGR